MRDFLCPRCGQRLAFENSCCLNCSHDIGFDLASRDFVLLNPPSAVDNTDTPTATAFRRCANEQVAVCNWVIRADAPATLCLSCVLTRTRPSDADAIGLKEFAERKQPNGASSSS